MQEQVDQKQCSRVEQAEALASVLRAEFGVPFVVFDASTGQVVFDSDPVSQAILDLKLETSSVIALAAGGKARVILLPNDRYQLSMPVHNARGLDLVAVAQIEGVAGNPEVFPARAAREQAMLQSWLHAVSERIRLTDQIAGQWRVESSPGTCLAKVGIEGGAGASPCWEALLLLDQVAHGLHIHKDPKRGQHRILEAASKLAGSEACLWVPEQEQPVLQEGKDCLKPEECRVLAANLAQSPDFRPSTPVLCNQVQTMPWGSSFPGIRNLMAFQVSGKRPLGWLIVLNKKDSAPFRRSDAALVLPFVGLLELQLRWFGRHQDLKDLLVGLTRSLTTAIDAKDTYTYGHSERVARAGVELGRELGLGADELGDIYLAGLLHDIGKIGIRDTVLHKPGALTPEEREHIQQHVLIGYSILSDLRQIRNLLPGVLYHHERYDGQGYPDGLAGEDIPLLARILAVADAYDAMSHPRPYRDSMPYGRVEEVLSQGAGTQWDQKVVDAFFRCRQRIHAIRQRGVGDSLRQAIDGALRAHSNSTGPGNGIHRPSPELQPAGNSERTCDAD
jgi:HD-GYP domain-containing protein (c-di-GMP phosphodiesterase class II)